MYRSIVGFIVLLFGVCANAQEVELPSDFRQHNLTQYNSSLFNPTFSFDRNLPRSVSLWSRWQWQSIDGNPTSILLNYTQQLNERSSGGIGFFQNNTGVLVNSGGILNYAYVLTLSEQANLIVGANTFLFQQKLADESLVTGPMVPPLGVDETDFIAEFTPSARLQVQHFNLAIALENALGFNLSNSDRENSETIFSAMASNDFPLYLFGEESYLRPMAYVRTIPDADTQFGVNALLANPSFWVQGGYNSFYGISGGAGVTILQKLSVGALVEFGLDDGVSNEDPTFELVASYQFGKQSFEEKMEEQHVVPKTEELIETMESTKALEDKQMEQQRLAQIRQDSINTAREAKLAIEKEQARLDSISKVANKRETRRRLAEKRKRENVEEAERLLRIRQDSIARIQRIKEDQLAKRRQDSITNAKTAALVAKQKQARLDSLERVALQQDEVQVQSGEKYQEVVTEDGLEPGFYLIANVFGTKRYLDNFMKTLRAKGLRPQSFLRSLNNYNYVYLERYNTIEAARAARDSKFNGKYSDALWIFRVRGQ
ncbi:PorP/SprF family type IX secretion system membrane protein [uncultured Croceitalea sp.]|uniref:PorP/SprF family type IX secretion system membrane protein n=1 Tax=uncultured Croceitalea sp. TaxID=1798908 RepID=UPI003305E490